MHALKKLMQCVNALKNWHFDSGNCLMCLLLELVFPVKWWRSWCEEERLSSSGHVDWSAHGSAHSTHQQPGWGPHSVLSVSYGSGLPLTWKPGKVREFQNGQGKVRENEKVMEKWKRLVTVYAFGIFAPCDLCHIYFLIKFLPAMNPESAGATWLVFS